MLLWNDAMSLLSPNLQYPLSFSSEAGWILFSAIQSNMHFIFIHMYTVYDRTLEFYDKFLVFAIVVRVFCFSVRCIIFYFIYIAMKRYILIFQSSLIAIIIVKVG